MQYLPSYRLDLDRSPSGWFIGEQRIKQFETASRRQLAMLTRVYTSLVREMQMGFPSSYREALNGCDVALQNWLDGWTLYSWDNFNILSLDRVNYFQDQQLKCYMDFEDILWILTDHFVGNSSLRISGTGRSLRERYPDPCRNPYIAMAYLTGTIGGFRGIVGDVPLMLKMQRIFYRSMGWNEHFHHNQFNIEHPIFLPQWATDTVLSIAEQICEPIDPLKDVTIRAREKMPILADALEDAGCNLDQVLEACRNPECATAADWILHQTYYNLHGDHCGQSYDVGYFHRAYTGGRGLPRDEIKTIGAHAYCPTCGMIQKRYDFAEGVGYFFYVRPRETTRGHTFPQIEVIHARHKFLNTPR